MVTLHINGQSVTTEDGSTVLTAARQAGIFIPTLCDHPALRPSGGCRLCLVEVEGARGPQTACTLPARPGLVVQTDTPALRESRRFVLNMLFSESNHICPFCIVSGGDCELQNAAYHAGLTHWAYPPAWQPRPLDASSPSFIFDANRCILCRRCVRACGELVGQHTLGLAERGAHTHLVADGGVPLGASSCVTCGVCVQVCPTGALYGRRDAYQGGLAHTRAMASVCVGCSVGCGLHIHTRDGRLVKLEGDWAAPVNAGVLCQLGRFAPLEEARPRLLTPLVRRDGLLTPVSWDDALTAAAAGLRATPAAPVAACISPRLSVEALAAFRQLWPAPAPAAAAPPNSAGLAALHTADVVVVFAADLEHAHQVAGFFVKRRLPGVSLFVINSRPTAWDDRADHVLRPRPGAEAAFLRAWLKAQALPPDGRAAAAEAGVPAEHIAEMAQAVRTAAQPVLIYTADLLAAQPAVVALLAELAAVAPGLGLLNLGGEANSRAAQLLGLDQPFHPAADRPVFVHLGDAEVTPDLLAAVTDAPCLVVAASYASPLTVAADVVLPVAGWAEQAGHYLNLDGRLQTAAAVLSPPGEARSNADALAGLAAHLGRPLSLDWEAALAAGPRTVPSSS
ncbi:MAG: (2Fe-2S)-binding protein [Anaerolineales bacterium]|nr:(2Fe-2S)-binding protein [Anaerolineales bacterium]